jgi:hypothetical protein
MSPSPGAPNSTGPGKPVADPKTSHSPVDCRNTPRSVFASPSKSATTGTSPRPGAPKRIGPGKPVRVPKTKYWAVEVR